ncbi:MAG: hypothetical protein ACYSU7_00535 [Planctomycetota bacterium]|jgi:hypothetical protein
MNEAPGVFLETSGVSLIANPEAEAQSLANEGGRIRSYGHPHVLDVHLSRPPGDEPGDPFPLTDSPGVFEAGRRMTTSLPTETVLVRPERPVTVVFEDAQPAMRRRAIAHAAVLKGRVFSDNMRNLRSL